MILDAWTRVSVSLLGQGEGLEANAVRLYFEWMAAGLEAMAMRLDLADCERAEMVRLC